MSNNEDKELLNKLNSKDLSLVNCALVKIRQNYVRNYVRMRRLSKFSVIKTIISFLENPAFCNVSLSIVADACLDTDLTIEVIRHNGVQSLLRILKGLVNDDVQNRACRALGNIAKSKFGFDVVHTMKPVSYIIKFLTSTTNKNCQQTAVRTLRILGKDSKSREIIVRENGIIYIAQLLHSNSKEVLICSTKALAELSENCSIGCAHQMLEMNSFKMLVELCSHAEKDIKEHSLMCLKNVSVLEEMRTDLLKVGAVKKFIEISMNYDSTKMCQLATLALCGCVDRLHLWNNYKVSKSVGLKAILEILRHSAYEEIHSHIIIALLPLCYEQGVPDILFDLEIIQILIQNLKRYVLYNKSEHFTLEECQQNKIEINTLEDCDIKDACFLFETSKEIEDLEELNMCSFQNFSSENDLLKVKNFENSKFSSNIRNFNLPNLTNVNIENNLSPIKNVSKYSYSSYLHLHSSGASSNCSPSSSGSYNATSPNMSPNSNPASPVADPWSPHSNVENSALCWSPVLSCSDSSDINDFDLDVETQNILNPVMFAKAPVKNVYNYLGKLIPEKLESNVQIEPFSASPMSSDYDNKLKASINTAYEKEAESTTYAENVFKNVETLETSNESSTSRKQKVELEILEENPVVKKPKLSSKLKPKTELSTKKCALDHCILDLLTQLSFHLDKKTNSEIASRDCFSVLMDYIVFIFNPNPKAEKLLLNLVNNRYCFEKLIMSGFVTEMDKIMTLYHDPIHCKQCSQISIRYINLLSALKTVAESDYGVGTLCHILSTSEKPIQLYAINAIANLIHFKPSLFKLIIQGNGLSLISNYILSKSQPNMSIATLSFCQIYQNLRKTKMSDELDKCCISKSCDLDVSYVCAYKFAIYDVTFCVNGKKILASRETICKNSDYFRALLEGHFSEKVKDVVVMPDISSEAITVIFHFLHGCQAEKVCPFIYRIDFSCLLELLTECEKFLLFDFKAYIVDKLCHKLFPKTISQVYQVARSFNSHALYQKALHFVLSMSISQKHTLLKCFEDLMNLNGFNVLNDMEILIQNIFKDCNTISTKDK